MTQVTGGKIRVDLPEDLQKLDNAVRRLIAAKVEHSWKGAKSPEDSLRCEQELDNATTNYRAKLVSCARQWLSH